MKRGYVSVEAQYPELTLELVTPPIHAQAFKNGEIHDWYRTVWGYSDHLVAMLLNEFAVGEGTRVLDPFCGTGTTLVECKKHGIESVGVDANPVSCFAANVKTDWAARPKHLRKLVDRLEALVKRRKKSKAHLRDPTYKYLSDTGMLHRGWICEEPLRKAINIKLAIRDLKTTKRYQHLLNLALLDTVIRDAANIKFGPELYCGKKKVDADVFADFRSRVEKMEADLELTGGIKAPSSKIVQGDSRNLAELKASLGGPFSLVICSPPYPCEHDYTRNSRLELAFIEAVTDRETLRLIKKRMVRSHTKGIYKEDNDASLVSGNDQLRVLCQKIDEIASSKTHGFARLYSKVTMEYFGGMKRHLRGIRPLLEKGAILAYVVGDQSSYFQIPIPTAQILGDLAISENYELLEIRHWRDRVATSTSKIIVENILLLRAN